LTLAHVLIDGGARRLAEAARDQRQMLLLLNAGQARAPCRL
jgi:hypothetical protein